MKGMKNWANATISICAQLKISMNVVKKKKKSRGDRHSRTISVGGKNLKAWCSNIWEKGQQDWILCHHKKMLKYSTDKKSVWKNEECHCESQSETRSTPVNHTPTIINLAKRYIFSVKLQKQCRLFGFVLQIMYCFTGAGWNNTAARYLGYLERMSCSIITSWPKVHISE